MHVLTSYFALKSAQPDKLIPDIANVIADPCAPSLPSIVFGNRLANHFLSDHSHGSSHIQYPVCGTIVSPRMINGHTANIFLNLTFPDGERRKPRRYRSQNVTALCVDCTYVFRSTLQWLSNCGLNLAGCSPVNAPQCMSNQRRGRSGRIPVTVETTRWRCLRVYYYHPGPVQDELRKLPV